MAAGETRSEKARRHSSLVRSADLSAEPVGGLVVAQWRVAERDQELVLVLTEESARLEDVLQPLRSVVADDVVEEAAEVGGVTGGEVRVQGKFSGTMETDCDRCLAVTSYPLEKSFDLFYRAPEDKPEGDEIKIDEGEAEIGFYEGLGIELADIIKEQVLLALPVKRTCREDCKGICPVCGTNRNESDCDCHERPADDRWNALKKLY